MLEGSLSSMYLFKYLLISLSLYSSMSLSPIYTYILIGICILYIIYDSNNNIIDTIIIYIILISIISIITIYNNLLSLFVSIELLNICTYIYLYKEETIINNINIIKYYIISSISSILYLLGLLSIYIEYGDIYIRDIYMKGIIIIIISILLKSGMGPFYIWKVELWNQLNPLRLLFVITLPIYLYFIILSNIYSSISHPYLLYLLSLSLFITIIIISIGYYIYYNITILLLYSSIYNTTLIYYNILLSHYISLYNTFIYIIIYIINSIGIVYTIEKIRKKGRENIYIGILGIYLMSYIGIPPLGGFYIKLYMIYTSLLINNIYINIIIIVIIISTILLVPLYLNILYYYNNIYYSNLPTPGEMNDHYDHYISLSTIILLFSPLLFLYLPLSL